MEAIKNKSGALILFGSALVGIVALAFFFLAPAKESTPVQEPVNVLAEVTPEVAPENVPQEIPPAPASSEDTSTVAQDLSPQVPLSPWLLEDSGTGLRTALSGVKEQLLSHPVTDRLVREKHFIRWLVAATDRLYRDENPYKNLMSFAPEGSFRTLRDSSGSAVFLDPRNGERFAPFLDWLLFLTPEEAMALYARAQPVLEEAYAELGNPDVSWEDMVDAVLAKVVAFDPPESKEVALIGREGVYIFQDEALEARTPLHKWMIRLGPHQSARLVAYVRQIQQQRLK
jgi:hypothetical protein